MAKFINKNNSDMVDAIQWTGENSSDMHKWAIENGIFGIGIQEETVVFPGFDKRVHVVLDKWIIHNTLARIISILDSYTFEMNYELVNVEG